MQQLIPAPINTGNTVSADVNIIGKFLGFMVRSSVAAEVTIEVKEGADYYTLSHTDGRYVAALTGATDLRVVYFTNALGINGQSVRFRSSVAQTSTVTLNFIVDIP